MTTSLVTLRRSPHWTRSPALHQGVPTSLNHACRHRVRLRQSSTLAETEEAEELLHPDQFKITQPASLSPSAVMEFMNCPQSFLMQYIYKLRQPNSLATAKGSMCHEALEHIFDLPPEERTLDTLHNLLRVSWGKNRLSDKYSFLFEKDGSRDLEAEREWGESGLQLLQNYYEVEDPRSVTRPNPMRREIWLHSHLTVDPDLGTTGSQPRDPAAETFYMRGIVDRLDMVRLPETRGVALKIVDYKTGKAPTLKYPRHVNERIMEESFFQLKVYALLLREKGASDDPTSTSPSMNTMALRFLDLLYLNSESGKAKPWHYDLGATQEERDRVLQETHQQLSEVWNDITALVALQDPKSFVGCDRSFCHCHKCRPRFVPGTLWEPES